MPEEKFTFFWSGPFSNWYQPVTFDVDQVVYNCSEQYLMAEKARLFNDPDILSQIMAAGHPRDQKHLGRDVKNFNKDKWNAVARDVMFKGCYAKFTQNTHLKIKLLATIGTTLVEASPRDQIWGIGLSESDPLAQHRETWLGTNWLGETLTKVRDQILKEEQNG